MNWWKRTLIYVAMKLLAYAGQKLAEKADKELTKKPRRRYVTHDAR